MSSHEHGFGIVDNIVTEMAAENRMKEARARNVTCLSCNIAECVELVLTRDEHELVSENKIWDVHDLKVLCPYNPTGTIRLSCPKGDKADVCPRCDHCKYADRTITATHGISTRGINGKVTVSTRLFHCKHMGRNDYCYPYFRCDKFKPLGDVK